MLTQKLYHLGMYRINSINYSVLILLLVYMYNVDPIIRKILKICPRAYIFQRPLLRGLFGGAYYRREAAINFIENGIVAQSS